VTTLRVTAIQPRLRIGEVDENLRRCEDLVRKAAADTAPDLIVLPEAVTSPNVYHPSLRAAPTPIDGPAYQLFCGLARELGCAVGAGYHSVRGVGEDRDAHHTYVLAEPGGATHLHDKDQPSVWENCYYVGGDDDGVMATSFGPIGCVLGFEANRSRTATRLRAGGVRLIIGGECLPSYPDWPILKGYLRREQDYFWLWAKETAPVLARAVGAPAALAFHVGDVRMRTPMMPGVPWPTTQTGETQIVERDGRVLARMSAADGEGWVSAQVTLADPEPADPIPAGFWLRPQPFSIHAVWHLMNRHGRLKYRLDKARRRFPWQEPK
jgi:predicted amidohydrolase